MKNSKLNKLNSLLNYVKENNEFYKEFYKDITLPIKNINELPILERKRIRLDINKMISNGYEKEKLKYDKTNGTTEGKPLDIYKTESEWITQDLDLWRIRRNINKEAAKRYVFYYYNGNDFSEPYRCFKSENGITLQIAMKKKSEYEFINDLKLINDYNIKWIIAPPSIIFTLCCISLKSGIKIKLDIIESISEYLPYFYKNFFEEILGGKVYIHYSCHEIWGMGYTNMKGEIEIIDQCILNTVKDERFERNYGRCIATNLRVRSMPFINYELSDLINIEGNTVKTFGFRWNEEVSVENLKIHCSFFDNIFLKYNKIELKPLENYQIIYKDDIIYIYIITEDAKLCDDIKIYVQNCIKMMFNKSITVDCKKSNRFFVDSLSGKMRGIIKYNYVNWDGWEFHLINDISKKYIHDMLRRIKITNTL